MADRMPDMSAVVHEIVAQQDARPAHAAIPTTTLTARDFKEMNC